MKSKKPRVREDGLVIKELPEETLVYDLDRHRAHCLNQTAAFVFKHCDGRTSVKRMSTLLQKELKAPPGKMDETVVWLALDKLAKAHLLQERISGPPEVARFGRRELVRRLGPGRGTHGPPTLGHFDCGADASRSLSNLRYQLRR